MDDEILIFCFVCRTHQFKTNFEYNSRTLNNLSSWCLTCLNKYGRASKQLALAAKRRYTKDHPEIAQAYRQRVKDRSLQYKRNWNNLHKGYQNERRAKNREKHRLLGRQERRRNIERVKEYAKSYRKRYRELNKKRELENPNLLIAKKIRRRINRIIINTKKGVDTSSIMSNRATDLGCSVNELRSYIESKFKEGMSWENYGKSGWCIDHIIPLSKFNLTNIEEYLKANHYTNIQPMWYGENISKGTRESPYDDYLMYFT